jgi:flagellar motor switch protein FliN/FliY
MSGQGTGAIREVKLRVAAELGRARMPLGRSVGLGPGAVIELDRAESDPIDLVVNGRRYATGRLVLVNGGEWAFQVEEILSGVPEASAAA